MEPDTQSDEGSEDRRLRTFLVGQLLALAFLAGAGMAASLYSPFLLWSGQDPELSGCVATLAGRLSAPVVVAVFVVALAGPLAYARLRGDVPGGLAAAGGLAVGAITGLVSGAVFALFSPVVLLAAPVVLVVVLFASHLSQVETRPSSLVGPDGMLSPGVLLGCVVLVAVASGAVTALAADGLVVSVGQGPSSVAPATSFEFSYHAAEDPEQWRLEIAVQTKSEPIPRQRLHLAGTGFADGPEVDQTEPGPWQGTTNGTATSVTGETVPAVTSGDEVLVGVRANCSIRVVYDGFRDLPNATLGTDECG